MKELDIFANNKANEALSKFKLLSAYGGAGSILHTQYGSIIISCINEWYFLNEVNQYFNNVCNNNSDDPVTFVKDNINSFLGTVKLLRFSDDKRFLEKLVDSKQLTNLKFLVLIPSLELDEFSNKIKDGKKEYAIPSTFLPKVFSDKKYNYKSYNQWLKIWESNFQPGSFFPPKYNYEKEGNTTVELLKQDNLVLICKHGHISDFPWSKYLRLKTDKSLINRKISLNQIYDCCNKPTLVVKPVNGNTSGFEGKKLKCTNCNKEISLTGLMNLNVICNGEKPWEVSTNKPNLYYGLKNSRIPNDNCDAEVKVVLTTGNNIYFSRIISSIYLPNIIFKEDSQLKLEELEREKSKALSEGKYELAIEIRDKLAKLEQDSVTSNGFGNKELNEEEKDIFFRYQEFDALVSKDVDLINSEARNLFVKDVTDNLDERLRKKFSRVLRLDTLKITSSQLDFSRVEPYEPHSNNGVKVSNIFKGRSENVISYPVVENYGEGIFFAFNPQEIKKYMEGCSDLLEEWMQKISPNNDSFSRLAYARAEEDGWQLYLVHTFCHLIMRELEFRCGYPTSSLQERIYVSSDLRFNMHGCLIYTAEGAEGSMGGLIAQTKGNNLNTLIKSAMSRATVCHSDPLCWESEGQGLFNLNFATCFSCGLVSETSCEMRNIYLDRKILVDENYGFFRDIL